MFAQLRRLTSAIVLGAGPARARRLRRHGAGAPLPHLDPPKAMYAAMQDDGFTVPAAPIRQIPPQFLRQVVDTPASIPGDAGTVVVDPGQHASFI